MVLLLENDKEFNERNTSLARSQQEKSQPVVFVTVKKLAPAPASRIINPELRIASSI